MSCPSIAGGDAEALERAFPSPVGCASRRVAALGRGRASEEVRVKGAVGVAKEAARICAGPLDQQP